MVQSFVLRWGAVRSLTPLPWASRVTAPLPGFFSTSAGLGVNRAVGATSCHARDHGTELGFPMPYFFVIVPLGVLVALAWLVLAKKAYENSTWFPPAN